VEQAIVTERPERRSELIRPAAAVLAVVAGLGCVLLGVTVVLAPVTIPAGSVGSVGSAGAGRADGAAALGQPVGRPTTLRIPSLELSVESLVDLGRGVAGRREQPGTPLGVGWFSDGPAPGEAGVAVFSGHAAYGYSSGAFALIGTMRPGQVIMVTADNGRDSRFVVHKVERFPADAPDSLLVAPDTGGAELRLITCNGTYDGSSLLGSRIAVYAGPAIYE
jgi:hypothetical protein